MRYTSPPGTAYWFQQQYKTHAALLKRVAAWEREAETNKNGFASIAPAVVCELKTKIAAYENARNASAANEQSSVL